jgi:hypothetical protein
LHGRRIAVAAVMSAVGLAVFGAFGGLSYAAEAISQASGIPIVKTSSGAGQQDGDRPQGSRSIGVRPPNPGQGQYGRTTVICHRKGSTGKIPPHNSFWVLIRVNNNALPAHKAHGDTLPNPDPPPPCPGPPIP